MINELIDAGVGGVGEFGRFVNNTKYFEASQFDEVAAAPVLLRVLPELNDAKVVATVGRHLKRPWVRKIDGAFETVLQAYERWAPSPGEVGWVLGDTLSSLADKSKAAQLYDLAADASTGSSRACIVESLWRFKAVIDVEPLLRDLVVDADVVFMAVTSLQRTIGPQPSLVVPGGRIEVPGPRRAPSRDSGDPPHREEGGQSAISVALRGSQRRWSARR